MDKIAKQIEKQIAERRWIEYPPKPWLRPAVSYPYWQPTYTHPGFQQWASSNTTNTTTQWLTST
jgi:hypothetical protein